MRPLTVRHRPVEGPPARDGPPRHRLAPVGRFTLHFLEMCAVMCVGAITLSVLFFGTAALLGYSDLPQRFPELSALVVAVNLSLPMAAWMRFRGMEKRPTLEMSGTTMAFGLLLIAAYQFDLVATSSLIELQARFACPLMLAVMLFRFRYYSRDHHDHARHAVPKTARPVQP